MLNYLCIILGILLAYGPASGTGARPPRMIQRADGTIVPNPAIQKHSFRFQKQEPIITNLAQLREYKNTKNEKDCMVLDEGTEQSVEGFRQEVPHAVLEPINHGQGGNDIGLDEGTKQSVEWLRQEIRYAGFVPPINHELEVASVFQELQIPIGLLNKCLGVQAFDAFEFIIDNREHMRRSSEEYATRWDETFDLIGKMLEVAGYFFVPDIYFRFTHKGYRPKLVLKRRRSGEKSAAFIKRTHSFLDELKELHSPDNRFSISSCISTVKESFGQGGNVARFIFTGDPPVNPETGFNKIKEIFADRNHPELSSVTIFHVSGTFEDTARMRELDEAVPFCDVKSSSFNNERDIIVSKQGAGFPYSYGFYIVSCLVGVNHPFDLDVLDRSSALMKNTFYALIGVIQPKMYHNYWDGFVEAQEDCVATRDMNLDEKRYLFEKVDNYGEQPLLLL